MESQEEPLDQEEGIELSLEQQELLIAALPSLEEVMDGEDIEEGIEDPPLIKRIRSGEIGLPDLPLQCNVGGKWSISGIDEESAEEYPTIFLVFYAKAPIEAIRKLNKAIATIPSLGNLCAERYRTINKYVDACLELELVADHIICPSSEDVTEGIPPYIMDGFADLGYPPDKTRAYRRRYRAHKQDLKKELARAKRWAVWHKGSELELLTDGVSLYWDARKSRYENKAMLLQLMLQEAGIKSYIARGECHSPESSGRLAWNVAELNGGSYLVDVTNPLSVEKKEPFIVKLDEVKDTSRTYEAKKEHFYMIRY